MNKIFFASVLFVLILSLSGCCLQHEWIDATCSEPQICIKCGKTEGVALGHIWQAATCTEAKTCSVCGATEGEALGHDWQDATCTLPIICDRCGLTKGEPLGHDWKKASCTEPETCIRCGETKGEALGHKWVDATCTEPQTCSVCGATEGEPYGHVVDEWDVIEEATCYSEGYRIGTCSVCGEEVEETLTETDHTPGDWEVSEPATYESPGKQVQKCTVCGEVLKTKSYELTYEEKVQNFKDSCEQYSYEAISRNPGDYEGEQMYFRGEVVQVLEDGNDVELRVSVTRKDYYWDDTIYVFYEREEGEGRILEDDIIEIYGLYAGTISYESIFGATITVPAVVAWFIDIE